MTAQRSMPPRPAAAADDLLIATFVRRVGPRLAATFSDEQLDAVRLAFSSRAIGRHALDWRRTVRIFGRSFYFVLLLGRDSRGDGRGDRAPGLVAQAIVLLALAMAAAGALALLVAGAYVLKTSLGIDVFPGVDMINDPAVERLGR